MGAQAPRLSLCFVTEAEPEQHQVDAELLAKALVHSQRAMHVLALVAAGREIRERLRIPTDIAKEFRLVCEPPVTGSYAQPVLLVGSGEVLDVPSRDAVLQTFSAVGAALSRESWVELHNLVPDSNARERIVDEYISLLPSPDSGVGLDLAENGTRYATFRRPQILAIHEFRSNSRVREAVSEPVSIFGELISIDFAAHKFVLLHHPTRRRVTCEYTDDVEELLLENRRGLVEVLGTLELDRHDRPFRMTEVYEIRGVDLSPITIGGVEGAYVKLRFSHRPYTFTPTLDPEGQLLIVEDEDLDIHVYAPTRSELISELIEQIEFLWLEYVATTDELTPGATALGQRLRQFLEPVVNA